jgi:hypothetical protein
MLKVVLVLALVVEEEEEEEETTMLFSLHWVGPPMFIFHHGTATLGSFAAAVYRTCPQTTPTL